MVSSVIDISERANRIIAIVKARYGLRGKSEAIEKITEEYENRILEAQFKPQFVEDVLRAEKEKSIKIKSIADIFK